MNLDFEKNPGKKRIVLQWKSSLAVQCVARGVLVLDSAAVLRFTDLAKTCNEGARLSFFYSARIGRWPQGTRRI